MNSENNPMARDIEDATPRQGPVPNYLVQAILVTICCCLPGGIVAIVYAAQVNGKLASGDYTGARVASDTAKMWCWISFGVGLAINALYLILQFTVLGGLGLKQAR
jgi:hypothetical protein